MSDMTESELVECSLYTREDGGLRCVEKLKIQGNAIKCMADE